jgi:hypothetical protein
MTHYTETVFYDPFIDDEGVRISGFSSVGGEFWMRGPRAPAGRQRRLQRERALEAIRMAIEAGLEPGEVVTQDC